MAEKKTNTQDLSWVILSPRITEKSMLLTDKKVYVFDVHKDANKILVKQAIKQIYNVDPVKVRIAVMPRKKVFSWKTRKTGYKGGGKKAYVYLSEKDSINIF